MGLQAQRLPLICLVAVQVSAMPFKALEQHFGHERSLSILDAVRGHSNEAVEVGPFKNIELSCIGLQRPEKALLPCASIHHDELTWLPSPAWS